MEIYNIFAKISKTVAFDNNIVFIDTLRISDRQMHSIDNIISNLFEYEYATANYTVYYNIECDIYVVYM